MKLYTKREDRKSILPSVFVTIAFLVFPIITACLAVSEGSFKEALADYGIAMVFSVIFFLFDLFFLFTLFRRPQKFSARLISKFSGFYDGQEVTFMEFAVIKSNKKVTDYTPNSYECYAYGENDLELEKYYDVYIKTFSWRIKSVDIGESTNITKSYSSSMIPIYVAIMFLVACFIALGILGIIFFEEYMLIFIVWIVFCSLCIPYLLINIIKHAKSNKADDSQSEL